MRKSERQTDTKADSMASSKQGSKQARQTDRDRPVLVASLAQVDPPLPSGGTRGRPSGTPGSSCTTCTLTSTMRSSSEAPS